MEKSNKSDFEKNSGDLTRREFLQNATFAAGIANVFPAFIYQNNNLNYQSNKMTNKYGLFGKLKAQSGKGAELGEILLKAAQLMENAEGCILYVVTRDAANPDHIHIMEVWESKEDHDNSLKLPGVGELIKQALPILDGKPEGGMTLEVLGGKGLS